MSSNLVLRSFYISPALDERLRAIAFENRTQKNDLIGQYLEAGMSAVTERGSVRNPVAKKPFSASRVPGKKAVASTGPVARHLPAKKVSAKKVVAKKAAASRTAR